MVTGASRGVGKATALRLARLGCSVAVNYSRSQKEAEETCEEIRQRGGTALAVQAEVSDDEACRRMMKEVVQEFGRLDILVNNAGTTEFIPHDDLEAVSSKHWERIFGVNLRGAFQCVRAARPFLEEAGEGEIVNVSSIAALTGEGSSIPYCASKAALNTLTVSLARALAPRIRVNAVAPGFIANHWTRQGLGERFEEVKEAFARKAVLKKVCLPEDIAEAIVGLITGSDLITGQILVCDAGFLTGPRL